MDSTAGPATAHRPAISSSAAMPTLKGDAALRDVISRMSRLKNDTMRINRLKDHLKKQVPLVKNALQDVSAHCIYFQQKFPAQFSSWLGSFEDKSEMEDQILIVMKRVKEERDLITVINLRWEGFDWKFVSPGGRDYTPPHQTKSMLETLRFISRRNDDFRAIVARLGAGIQRRLDHRENAYGIPTKRYLVQWDLEQLKQAMLKADKRDRTRRNESKKAGKAPARALTVEDISIFSDEVQSEDEALAHVRDTTTTTVVEEMERSIEQVRTGEPPIIDLVDADDQVDGLGGDTPLSSSTAGRLDPLRRDDEQPPSGPVWQTGPEDEQPQSGPAWQAGPEDEQPQSGPAWQAGPEDEQPQSRSASQAESEDEQPISRPATPAGPEDESVADSASRGGEPSPPRPRPRPRRPRDAAVPPVRLTRPPQLNAILSQALREMHVQAAIEQAAINSCDRTDVDRLRALVIQHGATLAQIQEYGRLVATNPAHWR